MQTALQPERRGRQRRHDTCLLTPRPRPPHHTTTPDTTQSGEGYVPHTCRSTTHPSHHNTNTWSGHESHLHPFPPGHESHLHLFHQGMSHTCILSYPQQCLCSPAGLPPSGSCAPMAAPSRASLPARRPVPACHLHSRHSLLLHESQPSAPLQLPACLLLTSTSPGGAP